MMTRIPGGLACLALAAVPFLAAGAEKDVTQPALRAAIEKSLPLLTTGAAGHRENRTCFACHSQGLPVLALTAAQLRGFPINKEELDQQVAHTVKFLDSNRENYLKGKGQGGQADTAGYALWTLAAADWKPDDTTAAVTEYLLQRHQDKDHWQNTSNRPPTEAGPFTTTYIALYGLQVFGTPAQQERIAARVAQVREWLIRTPAKDTEDRVFRLLALDAARAPQTDIAAAAKELTVKQQADGGWAQLDHGEPESATKSDAYATGTALVALHQAGGLAISDPVYQRGVAFLLRTQHQDGSWHVISRSKPFQAYFETGYPHGNDQFISTAAGSWATWAFVLAMDP
jgi:Squalene-hopene cyclase C-terminal domain